MTPITANAANVFLGGTPGNHDSHLGCEQSRPTGRRLGAGFLPLSSLAQATGLPVNGGDATANQLVVNATTEDSGGLAGTSGWGGAGMVSPMRQRSSLFQISTVRTAGNAYDTIRLSGTAITISNNAAGALLTTNICGGFTNPSVTAPAITVNSGA